MDILVVNENVAYQTVLTDKSPSVFQNPKKCTCKNENLASLIRKKMKHERKMRAAFNRRNGMLLRSTIRLRVHNMRVMQRLMKRKEAEQANKQAKKAALECRLHRAAARRATYHIEKSAKRQEHLVNVDKICREQKKKRLKNRSLLWRFVRGRAKGESNIDASAEQFVKKQPQKMWIPMTNANLHALKRRNMIKNLRKRRVHQYC
ncbi:hypothetical protein GEMRC1_001588 [Eukaryota sp. GEM-RC1]